MKKDDAVKPGYYGPSSKKFWKRVNALPHSDNLAVYGLGCALQDLEHRVLVALGNAELKAKKKKP